MSHAVQQIAGVILAGGKGSRMGNTAKPLIPLGSKAIIAHIIDTASPQVSQLIISANDNLAAYQALAPIVVEDEQSSYAGPMAGILSAMRWLRAHRPEIAYLACFPGDAPWFPIDIVSQLWRAIEQSKADIAWLQTDGQRQPLFSLWRLSIDEALSEAIKKGMYSPMAFICEHNNVLLDLHNCQLGHFVNLNAPSDLDKARQLVKTPVSTESKTQF